MPQCFALHAAQHDDIILLLFIPIVMSRGSGEYRSQGRGRGRGRGSCKPNIRVLYHDRFESPREDEHNVSPAWFEQQKQRHSQNHDPSLLDWLATEVDALKAYHDGHMNADEAALSMTHPISTSPVPALGGYSDEVLAVDDLWGLIIDALMEWPSTRVPEIFTLLNAIGKVPGYIHKGEALAAGKKLTWARFSYFGLAWHERAPSDIHPGQICRQYSDSTLVELGRKSYLKMKDLEAQLYANHVFRVDGAMIRFIIWALEKEIDQSDEQLAPDEATGYDQIKLDWHIPAVSFMFKYNGSEIYDEVVTKGLGNLTMGRLPDKAREFQNGAERWSFWRRRLEELSQGDFDDEVKAAAQASLEYMSSVV